MTGRVGLHQDVDHHEVVNDPRVAQGNDVDPSLTQLTTKYHSLVAEDVGLGGAHQCRTPISADRCVVIALAPDCRFS
jgi:hypothetical protein